MKIPVHCLSALLLLSMAVSCTKSDPPENVNPQVNYRLNLSGTASNCVGGNLTNGYVIIGTNQGMASLYVTNGHYDTTLTSTGEFDSVMVWALDLDNLKTSDTLFLAVHDTTINLGNRDACMWDADEYIDFSIGTEKYTFIPAFYDSLIIAGFDTLSSPTTYLYRTDIGNLLYNCKYRRTQFAGMTTGTHNIDWNSTVWIGRYYAFNMPAGGAVNYSSYGNPGDYITGSVNVPFVDNTDGLNYTLTGTFKVRRD